VPGAVDEAGGFAGFRETGSYTNSFASATDIQLIGLAPDNPLDVSEITRISDQLRGLAGHIVDNHPDTEAAKRVKKAPANRVTAKNSTVEFVRVN